MTRIIILFALLIGAWFHFMGGAFTLYTIEDQGDKYSTIEFIHVLFLGSISLYVFAIAIIMVLNYTKNIISKEK